jgi:predicted dehydrogenase
MSLLMNSNKLKIGLFGVGHLGKIHLKNTLELSNNFEVVGFYDPNDETSQTVVDQFQIKRFQHTSELIKHVDCVSIVAPTFAHFELALEAIRSGKHVFIEKPFTSKSVHAEILIKEAESANVRIQIGHVERFNQAFVQGSEMIRDPRFIEIHRLAIYNPRGTDVSVIMDLMIHDLDLLLSMVDSQVVSISASGVAIVHDSPDMASVRILFKNGCVANLTASRVSLQNMRRLRAFQENAYINIDLLNHKAERITLTNKKTSNAITEINKDLFVGIFSAPVSKGNAIKEELLNFYNGILGFESIKVTGEDGLNVLLLAEQIIQEINQNGMKSITKNTTVQLK